MSVFFSVIIPTYNRAHNIRKALDSLIEQSFKNFEVLVCDDGSTDDTEEVVKSYADRLNIKYLWAENWGGPAKPRNSGIAVSTGEWICFLDSDDWWYPAKLEACAKHAENYDFIYHSLDIIDAKNNGVNRKKVGRLLEENVLRDLIVNGNGIANSSVAIRRSIIDQVGPISEAEDLIAVEDYDYWLRVAEISNRFKFISESLGGYNWDGDSNISHISQNRIEKEINIFNKYVPLMTEHDRIEARRVFNYKIGRYNGILGNYKEATRLLKAALWSQSISVKMKSLVFYLYFTGKKLYSRA